MRVTSVFTATLLASAAIPAHANHSEASQEPDVKGEATAPVPSAKSVDFR